MDLLLVTDGDKRIMCTLKILTDSCFTKQKIHLQRLFTVP